jgi:hypothetical protein
MSETMTTLCGERGSLDTTRKKQVLTQLLSSERCQDCTPWCEKDTITECIMRGQAMNTRNENKRQRLYVLSVSAAPSTSTTPIQTHTLTNRSKTPISPTHPTASRSRATVAPTTPVLQMSYKTRVRQPFPSDENDTKSTRTKRSRVP